MPALFRIYIPYFKQILLLSFPIIIGQLGIVMMGVVDVMMIGQIGATELAASSFANAAYFITTIIGIGTLTALSPLIATAHAAGENDNCSAIFRQGLFAALLLSVGIILINEIMASTMHLFGQSEEIWRPAKGFFRILNISTLPLMFFLAAKQFSDGLSKTIPAAIITLIALAMNIVLNYILIYGYKSIPALGLNGAAIATTISRIFMALAMFLYVTKKSFYKPYLNPIDWKKSFVWLKKIFSIGMPSGMQYFFEVGAFAFAAIMIGWVGKNELAAHQIAINIASVTYMLATGISAGASIAVGEAVGHKNKTDIIRSGYSALILGTIWMGFCALLMLVANEFLIRLYTSDTTVHGFAIGLLWIAALFQLSDGLQCVSLGALRGITDTKLPTIITVIAYWLIGIPLGYYLCFVLNKGINGVWYSLLIALTFSAIMLVFRFKKQSHKYTFNVG